MNDRQTLRIPSWIRGFHVYKDWWTPTCGEILPLQPEPENAEDKNAVAVLKESRVIGHIPYHLANTKDRTGIITHFISRPTNRGSVEVSGKAVNRGGGLGMEIPCVYNFDGPSKHVNGPFHFLSAPPLLRAYFFRGGGGGLSKRKKNPEGVKKNP